MILVNFFQILFFSSLCQMLRGTAIQSVNLPPCFSWRAFSPIIDWSAILIWLCLNPPVLHNT